MFSFSIQSSVAVNTSLQKKALSGFAGASASLTATIACLRNKTYPDDIEQCGVSSVGTKEEFEKAASCILLNESRPVVPLAGTKKRGYRKIALVVDCNRERILIVFNERDNIFYVDGINLLLD